MRVRILKDVEYRGRTLAAGSLTELPAGFAHQCIAGGKAERAVRTGAAVVELARTNQEPPATQKRGKAAE